MTTPENSGLKHADSSKNQKKSRKCNFYHNGLHADDDLRRPSIPTPNGQTLKKILNFLTSEANPQRYFTLEVLEKNLSLNKFLLSKEEPQTTTSKLNIPNTHRNSPHITENTTTKKSEHSAESTKSQGDSTTRDHHKKITSPLNP